MSYYPTPGTPYVPQQPVNPYGGMGTVGLSIYNGTNLFQLWKCLG